MKPATERAYRAWLRAANTEGPRRSHPVDDERRQARIVRLKVKYETLLLAEKQAPMNLR